MARGFPPELGKSVGEVSPLLLLFVFVFVALLAGTVLFPVELLLVNCGQVAIVSGRISLLLELLILLAGIDLVEARMIRINYSWARAGCIAALGLSRGGASKHQSTRCQD